MEQEQHPVNHIAFLIDGNRRWAKKNGKTEWQGYDAGADNVFAIAESCVAKRIPFVTFWGLSSENFKQRTERELKYIFEAIRKTGLRVERMKGYRAGLRAIGDIGALPRAAQQFVREHVRPFDTDERLDSVVIAGVNYGGRDEILRAVRRLVRDNVQPDAIDAAAFERYLDTAGIPDPDLIVRTGGRKRLSGFMPWQSVYAELYFTDTLWPDFSTNDLEAAIAWYDAQERNFGK